MKRIVALVFLSAGLCLSATAGASPSGPPPLETIVGGVGLPWPVKAISHRETLTLSGATTVLRLEGLDGDMAGRPIVLVANYSRPPQNSALTWSSLLQENVEAVAGTGKARASELLRIDGFDFALLDYRPAETPLYLAGKADEPIQYREALGLGLDRSIEIVGVVSGSLVRVTVGLPDLAIDPAPLYAALRGWKPDVTRILRIAARMKERNDALIQGQVVTLVNARLDFQKDMETKLIAESVLRDATGRIVGRSQTVNLNRMGFWTAQAVNVRASCELVGQSEDELRVTHESWLSDDVEDGDATLQPAEAMTLAQVAGRVRKAKIQEAFRTFDGSLWIGKTAEHEHQLEIIRVLSGGVERRIVEQVDAQPLACRLDDA